MGSIMHTLFFLILHIVTVLGRFVAHNDALREFSLVRPALPEELLSLLLIIHSSDIEGPHAAVAEVSEPTSARYGMYLSKSEVRVLVLVIVLIQHASHACDIGGAVCCAKARKRCGRDKVAFRTQRVRRSCLSFREHAPGRVICEDGRTPARWSILRVSAPRDQYDNDTDIGVLGPC